jgi:CRP/FNR family transcriptional regulator, cyclic AMP receptor protein
MSEPGLLETLAGHPFLSGLEQRHLTTLAAGAELFTAKAGTFLAREGDSGNTFYLIRTGHVALCTHTAMHGEVRIQTLGPGEMFGWSWLVPPYRWQAALSAERFIRNYDPCISCATHFLRLKVEGR